MNKPKKSPRQKKQLLLTRRLKGTRAGASNSDRSMQSLILKFGDHDDNASQHSTEKEAELTELTDNNYVTHFFRGRSIIRLYHVFIS